MAVTAGKAFQSVKRLISHQPVLKYYNVHEEVTIQCDASEVGLGATLLQNGQLKIQVPVNQLIYIVWCVMFSFK